VTVTAVLIRGICRMWQ